MLDITSITTRLIQPIESVRSGQTNASSGKTPPVGGTKLPVDSSEQNTAPELTNLEAIAERITDFVRSMNRDLNFRVDEGSGRTIVTVLDGETKEVIRQIPSEEFLRMAEVLAENSALLLDTEA